MRVCFVSLMFSPSVGGTQVRAKKQAHLLQALGHDVTVVTLRLNKRWKSLETLDGLPVVRAGGIYRCGGQLRIGRLGYLPTALTTFLVLWRLRSQYDLIHVLDVSPLAAVTVLIGKMTQKPVVITLPNTGPGEAQHIQLERGVTLMADTLPNADFLKAGSMDWIVQAGDLASLPHIALGGQAILNLLIRSRAVFQCLSTRSHAYLISQGLHPEQIELIPGSVDTEKFRPSPERQIDGTKAERDIICVARLEYSKGIDVLLHAWARIMHGYGEGRGALKPQLERLAAELRLQNSVEFLGMRTDIVDLLQQSWGFVLPSRWEGMPNALLEAMACGLPCVVTRVSGSEDLIEQGINGLLVELEQPVELAHALVRIIEDTDFAQRLGQLARATVVREYQLTNVVERCLQLYRSLLGDKGENAHASLPCAPTILTGGRDE